MTRESLNRSRSTFVVCVAALLLACGSSTSPSAGTAAGSYTAISFITTGSSGQRNEILAGSTLLLNLKADGTTSGHLHVAAGASPALDADMIGTWTQTGMTVDITQGADTFVRNMPFELSPDPAGGWDLLGDQAFSGTRIQITLKRA